MLGRQTAFGLKTFVLFFVLFVVAMETQSIPILGVGVPSWAIVGGGLMGAGYNIVSKVEKWLHISLKLLTAVAFVLITLGFTDVVQHPATQLPVEIYYAGYLLLFVVVWTVFLDDTFENVILKPTLIVLFLIVMLQLLPPSLELAGAPIREDSLRESMVGAAASLLISELYAEP